MIKFHSFVEQKNVKLISSYIIVVLSLKDTLYELTILLKGSSEEAVSDVEQKDNTPIDSDFDTDQEEESQKDSDSEIVQEEDIQISWVSCVGRLKFLCEHFSMCEKIVLKLL